MKKIRLNLDSLAVETFETYAAVAWTAGTVQARAAASDTCEGPNCPNCGCKDSTLA